MPGWGVIPSIRVKNLEAAIAFYEQTLGFSVRRAGEESNISLTRGDANLMLESADASFYSDQYNEAIRARAGQPSGHTFYIEAEDLDALHARVREAGAPIVDALAERPWGQTEFTVEDPEGNWITFWKSPNTGG